MILRSMKGLEAGGAPWSGYEDGLPEAGTPTLTSWQSTQSSSFAVVELQVERYSLLLSALVTKFFPTGCIEVLPLKCESTPRIRALPAAL